MADSALTVIICFDHASVTGGQAKVAFESAIGLKRLGHEPIVFAAAGPISPKLKASGIKTICLDQQDLVSNPSKLAAALQGVWNGHAASALTELLQGRDPANTIVHVHGWAKALSPSIATPIARSGLPAVYTMHEYFQFCPNGGFYNYQAQHICKLSPLSAACWVTNCDSRSFPRKIWRNLRLASAKHLAKLPDVFADYVVISDFQHDIVAPLIPAKAHLYRIDNPISMPNLGPKRSPASGDIIFVGRLSPEKGAFVFAEAARRVGIRAVFVGDGPIAGQLAERYPEASLLGWHDEAGVLAALRGARALVFPSLWYEGQPLTVLEAKALGTPVVVSDACAGRESVTHGRTGLWFRSNDPDDLALALTTMLDDQLVTAMSHASHASYWADPPTLAKHSEDLVALYASILARRSGSPPEDADEPPRDLSQPQAAVA